MNRLQNLIVGTVQVLKKEILYLASSKRPRKILFDHLPKCGGSSLHAYLEKEYPQRKIFSIDGGNPQESAAKFKSLPQAKRYAYDLVKGHIANQLIEFAHPACLKVTILREPVDRIVSHYYYAKSTPEHYLYPKIRKSGMSLESYASSGISTELRNWYTTHFSGLSIEAAEANPEDAIENAMKVLLNDYDIVGLLENYSSFAERLRQQAGLRYQYQNEKVNPTQGRVSINDVPKSTIRVIEQINHLDVVLYRKIARRFLPQN